MTRPSLALATLVLAAASAGCDKPITSVCKQACLCSPCTDNDFDTCVINVQAAETKAQKKGAACGAKFETFLTCLDANLSCQMGAGVGTDKCAKEEAAVTACVGAFDNPIETPCQEANIKATDCGISQQNVGACVGQNRCNANCVLAATCADLMGFSQTLNDCEQSCAQNVTTGTGVPPPNPGPQ